MSKEPYWQTQGSTEHMPYVGKTMDRKRNARRSKLNGAHTAETWNAAYPVGTRVRYWPIYQPHSVPPVDTTTRSEAWSLSDGTAAVHVNGKDGFVCLSNIEVLQNGRETFTTEDG